MESSKIDKNTSGNKNVYYFLNRIISNLKNEISYYWSKSLKIREDSKQIAKQPKSKKYTISNTHWRVKVKSILNKGSAMTPLEKNTLGVLMKLTKNPIKFMNDKFGKQMVTFRNSTSEQSFLEKCQNTVYPWLKNLIFEKLVLSSCKTVAEFDGLKDKMLFDFFKSDEKTTESNKSKEAETENNSFMDEEAKEQQNNTKIFNNAIKNKQKPKNDQKTKNIEEEPQNLINRCEVKEEEKDFLGKTPCNCQKQMKEMSDQIKFLSNHVFLLWESVMGIRREQNDKIINSNLII